MRQACDIETHGLAYRQKFLQSYREADTDDDTQPFRSTIHPKVMVNFVGDDNLYLVMLQICTLPPFMPCC